ncbi:transporter [Prosthecobacter sp.]|uniref:transporter n=1 Tax=Prosthecobacter sp. TaxID=1965333 RepID=UPI0037852CF7
MPNTLLLCIAAAASSLGAADDVIVMEKKSVRPLSTDRPDQTESACSVPKGWFQVESNLVSFSRTYGGDEHTQDTSLCDFLLKYGITHNTDVQIGWAPRLLHRAKDSDGFLTDKSSGRGDLSLRMKTNLVGNDSGPYALALLPWVKAPVATAGFGCACWEYGLTINQELDIGGGWELGSSLFLAMAATEERKHCFEPAFTLAVGRDLTEKLAFYVETYQGWLNDDGRRYLQSSFDGGLTYLVTPNLKFDAGINWFFNGRQTLNPFVGVSFRF